MKPPEEAPRPLAELDLDEIEPGLVEATLENRRVLREAGWRWRKYTGPLPECYLEDGVEPVDRPVLITPVAFGIDVVEKMASKARLLVDPDDPNSDYLTADALLLVLDEEPGLRGEVPFWVPVQIRRHIRDLEAKGERDRLYEDHHGTGVMAHVPVRCRWIKADGTRCWRWSSNNVRRSAHCRSHAGYTQDVTELSRGLRDAKVQLANAAGAAAEALEELMLSAASEPVRLKASTEILDRVGVRGGFEVDAKVEVTETNPADVVRERLARLADRVRAAEVEAATGVIAGELVSEAGETGGEGDGEAAESEAVEAEAVTEAVTAEKQAFSPQTASPTLQGELA